MSVKIHFAPQESPPVKILRHYQDPEVLLIVRGDKVGPGLTIAAPVSCGFWRAGGEQSGLDSP